MGKSEKASDTWLVTYSDLITLLLVFFILLYALTPGVDESTFNDFIAYFKNSMGVMDHTAVVDTRINNLNDEWKRINEYLEEQGLSSEVNIKKIPEGVKVTLSDSLTFNSGSAELLPAAQRVLNEMATIFDDKIEEVEVQGHTDNVPVAQRSPYRSNWHLGAARAVSVVFFISNRAGLDPGMFKASSYGEYKPIANNNFAGGRQKNRRVEIYIRYNNTSQSTVQSNRLNEAEPQLSN